MNTQFEKQKLYNYLGKTLVKVLKNYKVFIAGGMITSLFCKRDINDVDIYFRSKEDAASFLQEMISDSKWIVSHTKKATMFTWNKNVHCQAIHFDYFQSAQEIFDKFDFTVCMGAFDFEKEEFVFHDDFMKHNAQKILKFNPKTAYPMISALRVQKYQDKGYTISKPEYLKILLTCVDLKVDNYEDLKEQMGGMYGVNYDNVLQPQEGQEFNIYDVIQKMGDLIVDDDYFKMSSQEFSCRDLIKLPYDITGAKAKVVHVGDDYAVRSSYGFDSFEGDVNDDYVEIVNIGDYIKAGDKFYKWVTKKDNKYLSVNYPSFEYKIGEMAIAKGTDCTSGIYCCTPNDLKYNQYHWNSNSVVLELEVVDVNDIKCLSNMRLTKALVVREVPEDEVNEILGE